MSTKTQVQTQAKTTAAPTAAHIPQSPVAVSEREADRPDIETQLEGAASLGHSLGAISIRSAAPSRSQAKPLIQRKTRVEEEELQTKPADGVQQQGRGEGFRLDDETADRINRARGGGQPLDAALQKQMGETMGHDFSGVRVHTDAEADALSQQVSARAFTTGRDIFFRQGEYNRGSSNSRELIAHELSHVVQQSSGRVYGDRSGMTVRPARDAFEQEADAQARKATIAEHGADLPPQFQDEGLRPPKNARRQSGSTAPLRQSSERRSDDPGMSREIPRATGGANKEIQREVKIIPSKTYNQDDNHNEVYIGRVAKKAKEVALAGQLLSKRRAEVQVTDGSWMYQGGSQHVLIPDEERKKEADEDITADNLCCFLHEIIHAVHHQEEPEQFDKRINAGVALWDTREEQLTITGDVPADDSKSVEAKTDTDNENTIRDAVGLKKRTEH